MTLRQLNLMESNLHRFIDLGRPGSGKHETCSLIHILSEVVELHRPRCKHADIEIRWEPPDDEYSIVGDAGQLADLFVNLVGNAVDAVGSSGEVSIAVSRSGDRIVVEVIDSGQGPSPEVASRLFEPFVTGKPEGIGLGLAVARHAAEAHGGGINWLRENGRTVFRVELSAGNARPDMG